VKRKTEVLRRRIFGENDSRINAGYMSIKEYLLLFLAVAAVNGFYMVIYQEFVNRDIMETHVQLVINILMGYVFFMAALLMVLIAVMRHVSWSRPLRRLSEAARNIAQGDFSVRITPCRKDGKKDFVEVIFDDFNTMARELESIEIMKNDFITNVSHEIKSPLSVIQSYAAALQNENLEPEKRHEYIKTIVISSQKLSVLVSNILKLNKAVWMKKHRDTFSINSTKGIAPIRRRQRPGACAGEEGDRNHRRSNRG
jgi:signal transduction histidine kinase